MSIFIPGNLAVENTRAVSQSALPDAPVIPDEPRRGTALRIRAGAALRAIARQELKLAERIEPAPRCTPDPTVS